jgi:hypothetical protein
MSTKNQKSEAASAAGGYSAIDGLGFDAAEQDAEGAENAKGAPLLRGGGFGRQALLPGGTSAFTIFSAYIISAT